MCVCEAFNAQGVRACVCVFTARSQGNMDVGGLGCLRDAFAVVGGSQAPSACDPAEFAERGGGLCARFLLLEDNQVLHEKLEEVFPRIGLIVGCNLTSMDASVRRKASNSFESNFEYKGERAHERVHMSAGNPHEVAWLNVFDSGRRSDMVRAVVPLAAACLIEGKDVVFHDKFGMASCVLVAAAVQKQIHGGNMYVSDYKYGFETMGLTCSDPLLVCILPNGLEVPNVKWQWS